MRLTRRGWTLMAMSLGLLVGGRLLGLVELYVAASLGLVLVVSTAATVGFRKVRLEVRRSIHPARVHVGTPCRVDLVVRNRNRRSTPVLRIEDEVSSTRGAQLLLAPMDPGSTARAAYRLPTRHRGIVTIGPLRLILTDPFGLAEVTLDAAGVAELTVLPHVDRIDPPPHTAGDDPLAGADHPNALTRSGEDFYALRRYVVGDDLRRVHWRATAHHDELMVRQDELPWQGRCTVLLDVRRPTMPAPALDVAVSVAASVVMACWRREDLIRLVTTAGTDSGFAAGHGPVDAIMEHLATAQPSHDSALRASLDRLTRTSVGGALVAVVTTELEDAELEALHQVRTRYGWTRVIRLDRSTWDEHAPPQPRPSLPHELVVTSERPFAPTWTAARGRRRSVIGAPTPQRSGAPT